LKFKSFKFLKLVIPIQVLCFDFYFSAASALPIGFGYNQGDLEFGEMRTKNFTVYYDKRAPQDANLALQSLEAAKPHMERWFNVSRTKPLVVNISALSSNASFANFITDSLELQTLGQGDRDLAWHEYTHATMYRYLDNWFGPAGAIIHLPWMEAWFLEGLAEAVSVSIGSDEQNGIERFHALSGDWPSWDRIHSLYSSGPFNYRGYATSGAFVSWIMRKYGAEKIGVIVKELYRNSMPWYWPWAFTPFNGFWPMDSALKSATGKTGHELYNDYKSDAEKHWKSLAKGPLLISTTKDHESTSSPWEWASGANKEITKSTASDEAASYQVTENSKFKAYTEDYAPKANTRGFRIRLMQKESKKSMVLNRPNATWLDGPWLTSTKITWHEMNPDGSKICQIPISEFKSKKIRCPVETRLPRHLRALGTASNDHGQIENIVFTQEKDYLSGTQYSLLYFSPESSKSTTYQWDSTGRPVSFASAKDSDWILTGSESWRYLIKLDQNKKCQKMIRLNDFAVRIIDSADSTPHVVFFTNDGYAAKDLPMREIELDSCAPLGQRTSPLLAAMRSNTPLSFNEAVTNSNTWVSSKSNQDTNQSAESITNPSNEIQSFNSENASSASWRGRPVFAFPWIAADDALGPQIGIISVPLMDEMQNETVRLTMLVGVASRFPYQDISITTNRFEPTWSLGAFRAQTYNGRYLDSTTGTLASKYLEEKGVHVDGSKNMKWKYLTLSTAWGAKSSHLQKYLGPARRAGHLNETYASVDLDATNGNRLFAGFGVRGRNASPGINKNFNYDVVGVSLNLGSKVGDGKIEVSGDASRTRGPKRRDLQEMYQPLKTLIPGSGAGYNQTSFALSADQGLFSPVFGENQARGKLQATHPLIKDLDKFLGLVYLSHLDASGFFNYGTAWRNTALPRKSSLIAAQGYNIDLFMDNKGVNFNVGLGMGQVLGKSWQGYWTFGFDALF
jgi:hypothetical protein